MFCNAVIHNNFYWWMMLRDEDWLTSLCLQSYETVTSCNSYTHRQQQHTFVIWMQSYEIYFIWLCSCWRSSFFLWFHTSKHRWCCYPPHSRYPSRDNQKQSAKLTAYFIRHNLFHFHNVYLSKCDLTGPHRIRPICYDIICQHYFKMIAWFANLLTTLWCVIWMKEM